MGRESGGLRAKDEDGRGEDVCRQMLTGRGHAKGTSPDSGVPSARDISAILLKTCQGLPGELSLLTTWLSLRIFVSSLS